MLQVSKNRALSPANARERRMIKAKCSRRTSLGKRARFSGELILLMVKL